MSRPKQKRARKPAPRPSRAKEREQATKRRPGGHPSHWILFVALVVFVVIAAVAAGLMAAGGGGGEQSLAKSYPIQGTQHIGEGESHPPYNSNPPTSGWHYASPAPWGIHERELPDEQLVHNLEHGGIWMSYQPSLDGETVEKLREIARRYKSKVLVAPRAKNASMIALAAWGKLDTLDAFDEGKIVTFIRSFINQGPETVPD